MLITATNANNNSNDGSSGTGISQFHGDKYHGTFEMLFSILMLLVLLLRPQPLMNPYSIRLCEALKPCIVDIEVYCSDRID